LSFARSQLESLDDRPALMLVDGMTLAGAAANVLLNGVEVGDTHCGEFVEAAPFM